uniref:Uncharacterized protein n=1 Tax=Magnusiomyces magnusii TaxID=43963 RepID=K9L3S4_MAGMU|nr:hypothetical protein [Magnusiomyces magnusii]AEY71979.2 hypothetical protein [Magnusiomyces magnusii]
MGNLSISLPISMSITTLSRVYLYRLIKDYIKYVAAVHTDAIEMVDGMKLPDEMIHNTEIGKFKLEATRDLGIYINSSAYRLCLD